MEPERGSRLLILDRKTGEQVMSLPVGHRHCLHLINCFEDGSNLILDILELESPVYPEYQPIPDLFGTVSPCRPVRYIVDLKSRSIRERRAMRYDRTPDFPSIDIGLSGEHYDNFWMLGISSAGQPGREARYLLRCARAVRRGVLGYCALPHRVDSPPNGVSVRFN